MYITYTKSKIKGKIIFAYPIYQFLHLLDGVDASKIEFYAVAPEAVGALKGIVILGLILVVIGMILFLGSNQYIQIDEKN